MKKFKKGFLNGVKLLVLLGLVIGLAGCEDPNMEKPATIIGTWEAAGAYGIDKYVINENTITYSSKYAGTTEFVVQYAGTIEGNIVVNAEHGYIIFKITDSGAWGKNLDKYSACHWKGLTSNSVELSSASNYGFPAEEPGVADTETAAEAATEFTTDNGYYSFYGTYTK